jgi:hypothetical protein
MLRAVSASPMTRSMLSGVSEMASDMLTAEMNASPLSGRFTCSNNLHLLMTGKL